MASIWDFFAPALPSPPQLPLFAAPLTQQGSYWSTLSPVVRTPGLSAIATRDAAVSNLPLFPPTPSQFAGTTERQRQPSAPAATPYASLPSLLDLVRASASAPPNLPLLGDGVARSGWDRFPLASSASIRGPDAESAAASNSASAANVLSNGGAIAGSDVPPEDPGGAPMSWDSFPLAQPATGNPNIERQGARIRATAAERNVRPVSLPQDEIPAPRMISFMGDAGPANAPEGPSLASLAEHNMLERLRSPLPAPPYDDRLGLVERTRQGFARGFGEGLTQDRGLDTVLRATPGYWPQRIGAGLLSAAPAAVAGATESLGLLGGHEADRLQGELGMMMQFPGEPGLPTTALSPRTALRQPYKMIEPSVDTFNHAYDTLVPNDSAGAIGGRLRQPAEDDLIRNWLGIPPERFSGNVTLDPPSLSGSLLDEQGRRIGIIERAIDPATNTAQHDNLHLIRAEQQKGTSKDILRSNIEFYRRNGISSVNLLADEVGGYAWAKYGFLPTQSSWNQLRTSLLERLRSPEAADIPFKAKARAAAILQHDSPRAIWQISDMPDVTPFVDQAGEPLPLSKWLLLNTVWDGTLDLNHSPSMTRFDKYVRRSR
jgi:hypothetical protein